jgi:hypothetical protein
LIIDTHLALGFAAGTVLNMKSGRIIEIEQRTIGKQIWAPDDFPSDASWPAWKFETEELSTDGTDLALAVSLTHDTSAKVRDYVKAAIPGVQRLVRASLSSGQGSLAVMCGRHAFELAEGLAAHIKGLREQNRLTGRTHIFIAGPGGFAVYLGQRQPVMGPVTLYEFDFEGARGGGYEAALSFPVAV